MSVEIIGPEAEEKMDWVALTRALAPDAAFHCDAVQGVGKRPEPLDLLGAERIGHGEDVLVAPSRLVDDDHIVGSHVRSILEGLHKGVGRLEGRNQPLPADGEPHGLHHFLVRGHRETRPPGFLEMGQDRRNPDIIQPGRDAVGLFHLAFGILQKIGFVPLGHADGGIVRAAPRGHP